MEDGKDIRAVGAPTMRKAEYTTLLAVGMT